LETVLFVAGKIFGVIIRVDTWIAFALGMTVLAIFRDKRRQAGRWGIGTLAALLLLAIVPLGDLLLQPFERSYPRNPILSHVDGIIVLGGAESAAASAFWQQVQLNEGAERLTTALALARQFPDARLLHTGGSGNVRNLLQGGSSESDTAARFFSEQGMEPGRISFENQSRNTAENASLSFDFAQPEAGEVWVLITSASHMPRAMKSFEAAGWNGLIAYPVDYRTSRFSDQLGWNLPRNMQILNSAIKESIGQISYRISRSA
jgi:uncharacterized SAM-binding protein YcdF (DUF218 family)